MRVRFWGVRGSIPTPLSSDTIGAKIGRAVLAALEAGVPADLLAVQDFVAGLPQIDGGTVGGNTTCVEVRSGDNLIIIDGGSGIRELGLHLMQSEFGRGQGEAHIFFTHAHWDHIMGWPYFVPAYIPGNRLHIYAVGASPRTFLDYQQNTPRYFPVDVDFMGADKQFVRLDEGRPVEIGNLRITNLAFPHPGISHGFRFEDDESVFVFSGDCEFKELGDAPLQRYVEFFRDADAVAFDSAYSLRDVFFSRVDWGHSSATIGVELAQRANAKRLITVHHDTNTTDGQVWDIARSAQQYAALKAVEGQPPVTVIPGYEGLTLELGQPLSFQLFEDELGGSTGLVQVSGGIDRLAAQTMQQRLAEALPRRSTVGRVVLDLSDLSTIDVASLQPLLAAQDSLRKRPLAIVAASPQVQRMLALAFGDDTIIDFFDTLDEAMRTAKQERGHLMLAGALLNGRYQLHSLEQHDNHLAIYSGRDTQLEQDIVAQVLDANLGYGERNRYLEFARRWRRVRHNNLLPVLDVVTTAGEQAVIFDPPQGQCYGDWAGIAGSDGRLPLNAAIEIADSILEALSVLHNQGLVLGGLRPCQVFISARNEIQLAPDWARASTSRFASAWLAPEQIRGEAGDARSDLYAFGLILYHLVMGRHPFDAETDALMTAHQLQSTPLNPRALRPEISRSLEHLMLKLLMKRPAERYNTAEEVRRALSVLAQAGTGFEQVVSAIQTSAEVVGRETEQRRLGEFLRLALSGHLQVIFLAGDVGIGKTAIAQWACNQARTQGARILYGRCLNVDTQVPYHPFIELIAAYARDTQGDQLRRLFASNPAVRHLTSLVPALSGYLPPYARAELAMGSVDQPSEAEQRNLLSRALVELFSTVALNEPVIVLIDDLHWADGETLRVFNYIVQSLAPDLPVLFLTTYRNNELPAGHPLPRIRQVLSRSAAFHELQVGPLTAGAVRQQLSNLLERPVPEAVAAAITRTTEGNPLFVEEIARSLVQEERVPASGQEWDPDAIAALTLPDSILGALQSRLRHLSPDAMATIELAAVIGDPFRFETLRAVSGSGEAALLSHLDEALRLQLVRDTGRTDELSFTHRLIHYVLLNGITPLQRRRMHRRVANALEASFTPDGRSLETAEQLAHHFNASGDSDKAVRYLVMAGQRAQQVRALSAASHHFQHAMRLLHEVDVPDALALDVYLGLAETQFIETHYGEAQANYETALTMLNEVGRETLAANVMRRIAQSLDRRGEYQAAQHWRERALERLRSSATAWPELQAMILTDIGSALFHNGERDAAERRYQEALDLIGDGNYPVVEAGLHTRLGMLYYDRREFERARNAVEHALQSQLIVQDMSGVARAHNTLARVFRFKEDMAAAEHHARESLRTAERIGDLHNLMYALDTLAQLAVQQGEFAAAEAHARRMHELADTAGELRQAAIAAQLLGLVCVESAQWDTATEHLLNSLLLTRHLGSTDINLWSYTLMAESWLGRGNLDQARLWADQAIDESDNQASINQLSSTAAAHVVFARIAASQQRYAEAERHFDAALSAAMQVPDYFLAARTYFYMARMEADRGTPDQATGYLEAAEEIFAKLSAHHYLGYIRQLRDALHAAPASSA